MMTSFHVCPNAPLPPSFAVDLFPLQLLFPLKGVPVCRQSFLKILGISASRLVRTRNRFKGVDGRTWGFLERLDVIHYLLASAAVTKNV